MRDRAAWICFRGRRFLPAAAPALAIGEGDTVGIRRQLEFRRHINTIRGMPRVAEAALAELRMRYQAAHAAYRSCVRAVNEATSSGSAVSTALLEHEAKALKQLTKTRAELLAAMSSTGMPERGDEAGEDCAEKA